MTPRHGLLLFAHGARDPRWSAPFDAVAERIRGAAPALMVELAYLELMPPSLLDAGRRLADADCGAVDIVPLFLGAGGHVRNDLPELLVRLRTAHPGVDWRLHRAIGEMESVIDAIAQAALQCVVVAAPDAS